MLPVFKYLSFKKCSLSILFLLAFCSGEVASQYANIESDSLLALGNKVYRKGNYPESEKIYKEAVAKYSSDKSSIEWIVASVGLGASLLDQGKFYKARTWIHRADSSISENTPLELQAYVKSNVGWLYKSFQELPAAYENYTQALSLAKESKDPYRIAQVSNSLSVLTYNLGRYDESINFALTAVQSFEEIQDLFLLSFSYSNLATAYEALSFTDKAEKELLKSLEIRKQLQNQDLISTSQFYIGSFYHRTGNYDKALSYYSKYLSYVQEVGDIPFIAPAYDYIGSVYQSMGEFEKALEYFDKGEQLGVEHNLRSSISTVLKIAYCYQKLGAFKSARSLYEKALKELVEKEDHHQIIETYLKISELELHLENLDEALTLSEKALGLSLKTESKQLKAKSYMALSKVQLALNNTDLALGFSKKAYQIASVFKGYSLASYASTLSKAFYQAQNDSAFYYAELAFSEIEQEQRSVYGDNLESGVFSNYADFYNEVAFWYLEKYKDVEKAFEVTERGRSRVLLERLSFSDSKLKNVLNETTLITLRQKEKSIDKLYRQIENSSDEDAISVLRDEIRALEFEYESYTNELHLQYPQLSATNQLEAVRISEIQTKLKAEDALIEYMFTEKGLTAFWFTKNNADFHSVIIDSSSSNEYVSDLVSEFRKAIQEKASIATLEKRSKPLYDLLIRPFLNRFDGIKNLLIVPEKSLSVLPFDALYIDSSFLVEQFNIKYLPSSSIYNHIQPPHRTTSKDLFAIAGSGFNIDISTSKNYSSLPSTLLEVDAVSGEFKNVLSLKNHDVSESKLKNSPLNEFRYLHFASHGRLNERNPQQSGLMLSELNDVEGPFQEDGFLNSKEISSLDLNADLVVLSACNTAVGKMVSGEGLQGLQRSFFKAGASSVVVSLWNVYDKSTASFMGTFYQNLNRLEGEEIGLWNRLKIYFNTYDPPMFGFKERALHQAKKEMLEHPYYNHPVYWAPFILLGK